MVGRKSSVKQVKQLLHQAILTFGSTGCYNWDVVLPQCLATLNSYNPPGSTMSRQNLCFNPHFKGYIRTIQYNQELFSPTLYSLQQSEGYKRMSDRQKRLLALSDISQPNKKQSMIVLGSFCVINRKPEELVLDDNHSSALTLKANKIFKVLEITKYDDHHGIPKEIKAKDMQSARISQIDCDRLTPLTLSDAFEFQIQLKDLLNEFPPPTCLLYTSPSPRD